MNFMHVEVFLETAYQWNNRLPSRMVRKMALLVQSPFSKKHVRAIRLPLPHLWLLHSIGS